MKKLFVVKMVLLSTIVALTGIFFLSGYGIAATGGNQFDTISVMKMKTGQKNTVPSDAEEVVSCPCTEIAVNYYVFTISEKMKTASLYDNSIDGINLAVKKNFTETLMIKKTGTGGPGTSNIVANVGSSSLKIFLSVASENVGGSALKIPSLVASRDSNLPMTFAGG